MTLVSVIIPLYNKARFLAPAVQSVQSQTYENFELIIVNDGSTDESMEIVRGVTDDRIRVIQQANAGPGAACNRGLVNHQEHSWHSLTLMMSGLHIFWREQSMYLRNIQNVRWRYHAVSSTAMIRDD